jgi:hypothetical protein
MRDEYLDRNLFKNYSSDKGIIDLVDYIIENMPNDIYKDTCLLDEFLRDLFESILLIDIKDAKIKQKDIHFVILREFHRQSELRYYYPSMLYEDLCHWFFLFQKSCDYQFITFEVIYEFYKQTKQFIYNVVGDNGIVEHIRTLQEELNELKAWKEKLKQSDCYSNFFID